MTQVMLLDNNDFMYFERETVILIDQKAFMNVDYGLAVDVFFLRYNISYLVHFIPILRQIIEQCTFTALCIL